MIPNLTCDLIGDGEFVVREFADGAEGGRFISLLLLFLLLPGGGALLALPEGLLMFANHPPYPFRRGLDGHC